MLMDLIDIREEIKRKEEYKKNRAEEERRICAFMNEVNALEKKHNVDIQMRWGFDWTPRIVANQWLSDVDFT